MAASFVLEVQFQAESNRSQDLAAISCSYRGLGRLYHGSSTRPCQGFMSKPPFQLQQIDHVVLRVRDPDAMQAFYCDVLGCTVERNQVGIGLLQLRAGSSLIDLVDVAGKLGRMGGAAPGQEGRNMDHLCLRVAPFDRAAIASHLQAHGARVGEFGSRYGAQGEGPSLYLFDPEDNPVELKGPPDVPAMAMDSDA